MAQPAPSREALEPDLVALLAAEERLERALADAHASADAIRAAAAAAAARDDAAAAAALVAERRELEATLAAATTDAVAALAAAARAETARWDALNGDALERACSRLLERLADLIVEDA